MHGAVVGRSSRTGLPTPPPDRPAVLTLPSLPPWFPLVLQGPARGMSPPRAPWRGVWSHARTRGGGQDGVSFSTYKKSCARDRPSHSALGPGQHTLSSPARFILLFVSRDRIFVHSPGAAFVLLIY